MSLVNKMLKDLEQRRADLPGTDSLRGLRASAANDAKRRVPSLLLAAPAVMVAAAGLWWFTQSPSPSDARAPAMVAAAPELSAPIEPTPELMNEVIESPSVIARTQPVPVAETLPDRPEIAEQEALATRPEPEADNSVVNAPVEPRATQIERPRTSVTPEMRKTARPQTADEQADQQLVVAIQALQTGDTREAELALRRALEAVPAHTDAAESLSALLLQQRRADEADLVLATALAARATQPRLAKLRARILADQQRDAEAIAILEAAPADGDADYFALLGALAQRQHRDEQAISAYRKAVVLQPRQGALWMGLAISLERSQQAVDAVAAYRHALEDRALDAKVADYVRGRISALDGGRR